MSMDEIKKVLGFQLELKATFINDDGVYCEPEYNDDGEEIRYMPDTATIIFGFGVNTFPTEERIEEVLQGLQDRVREQLGCPNMRLTTSEDFGFAGKGLNYKIKDK